MGRGGSVVAGLMVCPPVASSLPTTVRNGRRPGQRTQTTADGTLCPAGAASGAGSAGSAFGQPGGVHGSLRAMCHSELAEQVGDVVLDRLLGQEHLAGDLPIGQTVGEVPEDGGLLR